MTEGQDKSTPQPQLSVDKFGIADWMRKAGAECVKAAYELNCDEHSLRGVFVRKIADCWKEALRSVAGGTPPEDRGSAAVKACLRFIRQCVAGKCDELDLEVIRGEIGGVLRVAGGEPEQWISVDERLPENGPEVLVWIPCSEGGIFDILHRNPHGRRNKQVTWIDCHGDDSSSYGEDEFGVTHWRPLPAPPGEEQK